MNADARTRIKKIVEFILARRAETEASGVKRSESLDYRWKHTLRVTQFGKQIAEAEGANEEIVIAACLLHDIAKFASEADDINHGRVGASIVRPFLSTLGYSAEEVANICFSIAVHVDDKADFEHPVTIESKIVSDADNVDRFGAYRILLRFYKDIDRFDKLIVDAEQRLVTLKKYREQNIMGTATGNRLFNRQLDLEINFLENLITDGRLTVIPEM